MRREVSLKVVYYGPGQAGKATSLTYLHGALRADVRGQLVSVVTGGDRTLFFDFFPPPTPRLQANALRLQLYTTPGQVHNPSTHRGLLEGVDAIVFVADSRQERVRDNLEAMERLRQGLAEVGLSLAHLPHVFAWNKRDQTHVLPVEELHRLLNQHQAPAFETVAIAGHGLFDVLKAVTGLLVTELSRRRGRVASTPGRNGMSSRRPLLSEPPNRTAEPRATPTPGHEPAAEPWATPTPGHEAEGRRTLSNWLQPLSSGQTPPPSAVTRPLWLSQITPSGPIRDQLHEVELDLSAGQYAQAVHRATALFEALSQGVAGPQAEEGHAWRALALGIPADRYLRFREAVRSAQAGMATLEDGLFSLFFLIDVSLRRQAN
ncbi:MAG: hypothetical protein NZ890_21685, partial [Myxococcota bacterium]|nr:hypothetical protein [Myxococcota bacterium]